MKVGEKVKDFTLQNQDGEQVRLSDTAGKPVVLFFYPRADTPGCTVEACGLKRDKLPLRSFVSGGEYFDRSCRRDRVGRGRAGLAPRLY